MAQRQANLEALTLQTSRQMYADVHFHESSLILIVIRIKAECFVQVIQHNLLVGGSLCKVIMVRHC